MLSSLDAIGRSEIPSGLRTRARPLGCNGRLLLLVGSLPSRWPRAQRVAVMRHQDAADATMNGVSTIVFVHAHPDDEASQTSGTQALASRAGHRVVVVFATNGDLGEAPDDLAPGELIRDRRRAEAAASAEATGTARLVWLGYTDSGMSGWPQNTEPGSFHTADVEEAARVLADVLDEEDAAVVIGYDWHGGYGHPDHVKVHRVTRRAAELARRRPRLLESTTNRDRTRAAVNLARERGIMPPGFEFDPDGPGDDGNPIGTPEAEIHWAVDVSGVINAKRASLACHASQVTDIGMFMSIPEEHFGYAFSHEFYIEPGRSPGMVEGWPFGEA